MRIRFGQFFILAATIAATGAIAEEAPHWSYEGDSGPSKWGGLSPEYATCGSGKSQSPVDIRTANLDRAKKEADLGLAYKPAELAIVHWEHRADVVNTGHAIQVNYPKGSTLTVGGKTFGLLQYHFHSPSEHTVDGKHFPMEMHMVHKSGDGALAVVGVFLAEGKKAHPAFAPIVANLPKAKGDEIVVDDLDVDATTLLPSSKKSYRYSGSLTTPPCSENVTWIVMEKPVEIGKDQVDAFRAKVNGNNRPTQPLNGRAVASDGMKTHKTE
jgi:carbonic anhydrase